MLAETGTCPQADVSSDLESVTALLNSIFCNGACGILSYFTRRQMGIKHIPGLLQSPAVTCL